MDKSGGSDPFSRVRARIQTAMVEETIPSIAIAVAKDGEICWEEAFGWADLENRLPATPHTLYSLASVSKPITAAAIMLLEQRGLLHLDRPINDYLGEPGVRARIGEASGATVRRVANHTSGLPLHYHFFPEDEPYSRPPLAETVRRYANLVTPPGEKYQYSNLGYGLLDAVIARLSGKSYPDFMRGEVFLPLGMTRASVDVGPGLEPFQAARYGAGRARLPFYDFDHPGASAVFCSAHDLARFGMFHLKTPLPDQKAILSGERIDAMQEPAADTGEHRFYGIGWGINETVPGFHRVGHRGGMAGVNTILELLPSERLAIAVLANANTDLPFQVADEVAAALIPEYAEALRSVQDLQKDDGAQVEEGFQPPPGLLGEWRGAVHTYEADLPLTLSFKDSGDIHAQVGSGLKTLLNDARFKDGRLTGRMLGDIGTDDAARRPYHLHVDMTLRDTVLNGAVVAIALPGKRTGFALSHWAELRKV
jgi:CubicO group peptidase (beta-lactamase class C family)